MYLVKEMYRIYEDDFGGKRLIPASEYVQFISELTDLENLYEQYRLDGSEMSKEKAEGLEFEIDDFIDNYPELEGEEVAVVFAKDIIKKGINMEGWDL